MSKPSFVYVTYIAATPEKVWEALTSGEFTQQYFFGRKVESDWEESSEVRYLRENDELDVYGRVLISDPYKLLSFTWMHADTDTERNESSKVTFEIHHLNETVKLTLKHELLSEKDFVDETNTFYGLNNGWPAIISNLKSLLETGKTLPAIVV
jgi:uncharacterized protein YndB with AHSA1/START domain